MSLLTLIESRFKTVVIIKKFNNVCYVLIIIEKATKKEGFVSKSTQ